MLLITSVELSSALKNALTTRRQQTETLRVLRPSHRETGPDGQDRFRAGVLGKRIESAGVGDVAGQCAAKRGLKRKTPANR